MPIGGSAYGQAKQRHSTAASLASTNPVPAAGEFIQAIDGTSLILKQGDGVRAWNALPTIYPAAGGGGGGVITSAVGINTSAATTPNGANNQAAPDGWTFLEGDPPGLLPVGGSFGWGYPEAGLFQVGINLFIGFTGGTPAFYNVELVTWWGDSWSWDVPCLAPASINGRTVWGAQATLLTTWHWMPALSETGTDQSANQLIVRWPGNDATMVKSNGSGPGSAVTLYVNRFA